jgi:hypothetical protein
MRQPERASAFLLPVYLGAYDNPGEAALVDDAAIVCYRGRRGSMNPLATVQATKGEAEWRAAMKRPLSLDRTGLIGVSYQ